jgi:hypothetical protein
VPIRFLPAQSHHSLLPWGLTACAVIAGPPLYGAAQASPAVTVVAAGIALTALVVGLALRQKKHRMSVAAPARRRIRTLMWSPP